jgi:hypothetical protein
VLDKQKVLFVDDGARHPSGEMPEDLLVRAVVLLGGIVPTAAKARRFASASEEDGGRSPKLDIILHRDVLANTGSERNAVGTW